MKHLARNLITLGAIVGVLIVSKVLVDLKNGSEKWTPDSGKAPPLTEHWQVVKVSDGDTITVKRGTETKKIRFCGIDAPEKSQPMGKQATEKMRSLVALAENQVMIIPVETDRYGRTVAEVMAAVSGEWGEEMSFQEEMLKSGNAYLYRRYAKNCPNVAAFEKAEEIAQEKKLGVWKSSKSVKPWDYRRQRRSK